VHLTWAQIAGRQRGNSVVCICSSVTLWLVRRAAGGSEWVIVTEVLRTSDPSDCRRRSAAFFRSTDWQWILGMETGYNTLHYNANSVITWLHSANLSVWCGDLGRDSNGCEDIRCSWSMVSMPHPEYTLDRAHHQQWGPIKNPTTITVWCSPLQMPSLRWSHLQSWHQSGSYKWYIVLHTIQTYANTGTNASTFAFYLKSIFTFTWAIFLQNYFNFYLSKNIPKYLYFYLSTNINYFLQHWLVAL